MSESSTKFATVLGCMDGRSVVAIAEFLKREYDVDYPDMITAPGMDLICGTCDESTLDEFKRRVVAISVGHHGSRIVAVAGHEDCAGNPVTPEEHAKEIKDDIEMISKWELPTGITLLGLWVAPNAEGKWEASVLEKRTV